MINRESFPSRPISVRIGKIIPCHVSRLVVCKMPFTEMTPGEMLHTSEGTALVGKGAVDG